MIEKGSLKLRLMADMTIDDESWKASFDSFGKKLIKKLEDAYYGEQGVLNKSNWISLKKQALIFLRIPNVIFQAIIKLIYRKKLKYV